MLIAVGDTGINKLTEVGLRPDICFNLDHTSRYSATRDAAQLVVWALAQPGPVAFALLGRKTAAAFGLPRGDFGLVPLPAIVLPARPTPSEKIKRSVQTFIRCFTV